MTSRAVVTGIIRDFSPAYVAMVMATGILSIAGHRLGHPFVPVAPLWLNAIAYVFLWVVTIARLVWSPRQLLNDLISHQRGPGSFTSVAASCILGSQCILIAHQMKMAIALWVIGMVLWLVLTYAIFTAFTVKEDKPTLDHHRQEPGAGGWPRSPACCIRCGRQRNA